MTVHRSRQDAPSSVSASGGGVAVRVQVTDSARSAGASCIRTHSAFSSMSRPVSTSSTELRNPPSSLTHTLSRSGGAEPRTPEIATRSGPCCSSCTESSSVVTSGPR